MAQMVKSFMICPYLDRSLGLALLQDFAFFRFLMLTLIIVLVPIKMSMQLHR